MPSPANQTKGASVPISHEQGCTFCGTPTIHTIEIPDPMGKSEIPCCLSCSQNPRPRGNTVPDNKPV